MGLSKNWGSLFGRSYNKDYIVFGVIQGYPYFRKHSYCSPGSGLGMDPKVRPYALLQ